MKTVKLDNVKAVEMVRMACINAYHTNPRITAKVVGGKMTFTVTVK